MNKFVKFSMIFFIAGHLSIPVRSTWAQEADRTWTMEQRLGRYFYMTRGQTVWGHELAFFKDPDSCNTDFLWLTLGSYIKDIKQFKGREATIVLTVNQREFEITLPVLGTRNIGYTNVMIFTNYQVSEDLKDALASGKEVQVTVKAPSDMSAVMDITNEYFNLQDFKKSRSAAALACREAADVSERGGDDMAVPRSNR